MIRVSKICLLAILLVLGSCRSTTDRTPDNGMVSIGYFSSNDRITSMHVHALLGSHGIMCISEGSIVHGISVRGGDAKRALDILREDTDAKRCSITLFVGKKKVRLGPKKGDWGTPKPKKRVSDLTPKDGVPQACVAALKVSGYADLDKFPYLIEIKYLKRRYLDADGRYRGAYDFDAELAPPLIRIIETM